MNNIITKTYQISALSLLSLLLANSAFAQGMVYDGGRNPVSATFDSTAVPGVQTDNTAGMGNSLKGQPGDNQLKFERNATCTIKGAVVTCPKYMTEPDTVGSAPAGYVQNYENMELDNCPEGTIGKNTYTRKTYTKAEKNGEPASRYEEPWYLTQNNCRKAVVQNLTAPQQAEALGLINQSTASIVNSIPNLGFNQQQLAEVQQIMPQGVGTWATPTFTINLSSQVTAQTNVLYVCVWGNNYYAPTLGGHMNPQNPGNLYMSSYYNYNAKMYPGWPQLAGGSGSSGNACPAGSMIQQLDTQTICNDTASGNCNYTYQ